MGEEKIGMEQNENTVEVSDVSNDNIQNIDANNMNESQAAIDYEVNTDVAVKSKKTKGVVVALIILVILILVSAAGYLVYDMFIAKNDKKSEEYTLFYEDLVPVKSGDKWGYMNTAGELTINPQFESVGRFSEGLASVKMNGKYGYIDNTGNFVINAQWDYAGAFEDGLAIVGNGKEDSKYGYIDKTGNYIVNPQFSYAKDFSDGLAVVKSNDKYGYIGKDGKYVINPQYEYARDFKNGMAVVSVDYKYGFIDTNGKYIINPQFEDVDYNLMSFYETNFYDDMGIIPIRSDNKYGFIDFSGKIVITPQYDSIYPKIKLDSDDYSYDLQPKTGEEGNYLIPVKLNEKWGFIDNTGKTIINPQFESLTYFHNGVAMVTLDGKFGFINEDGKYTTNPILDYVEFSYNYKSGDLCPYSQDNKIGYVNPTDGGAYIQPQYDDGGKFNNGFAIVEKDGKYGYINSENETITNFIYKSCNDFRDDGYAVVKKENDKLCVINKNGEQIGGEYDSIDNYSNEDKSET